MPTQTGVLKKKSIGQAIMVADIVEEVGLEGCLLTFGLQRKVKKSTRQGLNLAMNIIPLVSFHPNIRFCNLANIQVLEPNIQVLEPTKCKLN